MPEWTDAQARAIYAPSGEGNILVSAAAGSGKTAVLVERIADMISERGVSIDELLIVTFTEAASAEMKERIITRINERYRAARDRGDTQKSKYLKEQMRLTPGADINTIDAFCLSVVKNNFHILGIDADFGIMDKNEGSMLMDDAFSQLFQSLYALESGEERERFIRLCEKYASNRDDEGLKSIIRKVYLFIQSFPEPLRWLYEKADMYDSDITDSAWFKDVIMQRKRVQIIKRFLNDWHSLHAQMLSVAEERGAEPHNYWGKIWENVCACRAACDRLEQLKSWEDIHGFYTEYIEKKQYLGIAINKIPAKKEASDEEWQTYYDRYNLLRNLFRDACMELPSLDREEYNEYIHSAELKQTIDDIAWLTEQFTVAFDEKKSRKNVKSFSDIEHLAYRLFKNNENIRAEYTERYTEILIDEYQDTNSLQDSIFTAISRESGNMFMVGDLKQSIYGFRGGDPAIFKHKSGLYASGEGGGMRIMLSQNFRSRREVIDSINTLFSAVMTDEVGDVDYNSDEALKREESRECYTRVTEHTANKRIGYRSQLYRIAAIDEDAELAEAAFVADKIKELVDSRYQVYDIKNSTYRDIEYRDIVILMRATKKGGPIMRDMLETRGISSFVQKEEYFERREIKLMLSLVSLINNHMQDIPLTAVMRSPIGDFTESELARIKIGSNAKPFYKAVKSYKAGEDSLSDSDRRLRAKCRRFVSDLDRWRGYVKLKPIASLIWTLYEETGFYDLMGALEGGEEAQANLRLLYERAKRYEDSGFKGIFNFIRYIERMENRNEDVTGARLVNESHNVVRIMTIHKSKGLEFPVVFLTRTAKGFVFTNPRAENRIKLHKELGIGIDYYNYENMYKKELIFNKYIKEANKREFLSEEMRLLYVAMTRAKEKLIVTAANAFRDSDESSAQLEAWREKYLNKPLPPSISAEAGSYADWIIPVVESGGSGWSCEDVVITDTGCEAEQEAEERILRLENPEKQRENIRKILEFEYAYPLSGTIPAKTSVTAIKEMEDEQMPRADKPVYMAQRPRFLRAKPVGAQIGTAHHQVMAFIDLDKIRACDEDGTITAVREEIARIADEGQLEKVVTEDSELTELIAENVSTFFKGDMGKMLLKAKQVYRERPFEISIAATEYDASLGDGYSGEAVIVQGIIDLYFVDDSGNITLVDYKTDYCKTAEEQQRIAQKYSKQLELYSRAMEKILKKPVNKKYLYLFSAHNMIELI